MHQPSISCISYHKTYRHRIFVINLYISVHLYMTLSLLHIIIVLNLYIIEGIWGGYIIFYPVISANLNTLVIRCPYVCCMSCGWEQWCGFEETGDMFLKNFVEDSVIFLIPEDPYNTPPCNLYPWKCDVSTSRH